MSLPFLGIIPARGGSKGVPRKNIRQIAGRPLIAYTIQAAQNSRLLTRFVTSTDDPEISQTASSLGCEVIERPSELAQDTTPMLPVIQHVLLYMFQSPRFFPDVTVILQPTSPMRTGKHIDEALTLMDRSQADTVISVSLVPEHYNPHWQFTIHDGVLHLFTGQPISQIITRRQDLPHTYTRNGAIYAFKTDLVFSKGSIYSERCIPYVMPYEDLVNIDSEDDIRLAELLLLDRQRFRRICANSQSAQIIAPTIESMGRIEIFVAERLKRKFQ